MLPSLNSFSFLVLLSLTAIGVYAGPTSVKKGESSRSKASRFDSSKLLGYAYYSPNTGMVGDSPQVDIFPSYRTVPQYAEKCQKCLVFDDNGWVKKNRGTGRFSIQKTLVDDETQQTQHTSVLIIPNALWHEASLRIECPQWGEPGYDYEKPVNWKRLG
ncbi:hypothetical protein C8J55DRAFT_518042 [Lentinula edodes]|uniref:Uncharacterized protein n=1 Tax=Lentinula lateritia TaxID=40482 RepID=A0A9W9A4W9_9AGAR|nr:hypothetical protein C8J55DRAFT_518042 [Lentinula edodes]